MFKICIFILSFIFYFNPYITYADSPPHINRIFPLENYSQNLDDWFNEKNENYKTLYLEKEIQNHYFKLLKEHFYGKFSPWSYNYINFLINPEPKTEKTIYKGILTILNLYKENNNHNLPFSSNTIYGLNFRKLDSKWFENITNNINLKQFQNLKYIPQNRAITTNNIIVKSLPTLDAGFNTSILPGSGYPFNLFNLSFLPASTPIYVLGTSKDKAWLFIVAPAVMGWVNAKDIAYIDNNFINNWRNYANKHLISIITTDLPLIDSNHQYQFSALVGTLLPLYQSYKNYYKVMIPVKTSSGKAIIKYSLVSKNHAALVPLPITMQNFSKVIKTLIGRPYGWGGRDFYSDCSLELMSIYKVFGIFLTRNSAAQATYSGQIIDISKLPLEDRLNMIAKNAIPFTSLLYFKGHIMIYIGSYPTSTNKNNILMTYQNIWGLAPQDKSWRDIIGQAVIFPLLLQYPEVPNDVPLISKDNFLIINLIKPHYKPIGLSNLLY